MQTKIRIFKYIQEMYFLAHLINENHLPSKKKEKKKNQKAYPLPLVSNEDIKAT